jgi:adenine-specific DNA-methyltransferase
MSEEIFETPSSTPNFQTELAEQLAKIVPEAVADGKIDLLKLKELLAQDGADASERFGLFWPGKQAALRVAQMPTNATLLPEPSKSKDWGSTQNVFIEGDNLEVLKLLQKHYHGKIQIIYIDPPYNTGRDFVYKDDFAENLRSYLDWTSQTNADGKAVSTNSETDGRFHSNWLSMMYPRLKLARNLLTDDGVIFISIGREEVHHLKSLCVEVFGERNVVATLSREQKSGSNQGDFVAPQLDFVIACARNVEHLLPFVLENRELERDVEKSLYQSSLDPLRGCVNQRYWIQAPDGTFIIPPGDVFPADLEDGAFIAPVSRNDKVWRWSWASYLGQKDQLVFKETGRGTLVNQDGSPSKWNVYTSKSNQDSDMRPRDYIFGMTNSAGTSELQSLGLGGLFDNPKPTDLIKYLIDIVRVSTDATILDFFGGSGTTAHAVMALNAQDGGKRKFILVQLTEPTETGSDAQKSGFMSIPDITRKRIQLAGEQIIQVSSQTLDLQGSSNDVGYRSYVLSASNFAKWQVKSSASAESLEQELFSLRGSADDEAKEENLLAEVLIKQGYSLTEPIEKLIVGDLEVHSVGGGLVIAYLNEETKPTLDSLREIVSLEPSRLLVLEDSFKGDDELKTNLAQLCKSKNIEFWTA